MNRRATRCMLLVLAISLMAAPLRGVLAMSVVQGADHMPHCAMMQHGAQPVDHASDSGGDSQRASCPACKHGCTGAGCAGCCAAFSHLFVALSDHAPYIACGVPVTPGVKGSERFPERSLPALFRPPIALS